MDGVRLLVAVALLGLSLAPSLVSAQSDGSYVIEGVEYYYAAGNGGGHVSPGTDLEGDDQMPFIGCASAQLRPDNENGRIRTLSKIDGTPFEVEISSFSGHRADMQGGIALSNATEGDVFVDGSRMHGAIQHPAVRAEAAAWGQAYLRVDGIDFVDPATGQDTFQAYWFVTDQAFRDDATGQIRDATGGQYAPGEQALLADAMEMHLRIESAGPATAPALVTEETRPGSSTGMTSDYFPPTSGYREVLAFPNQRYGGSAALVIDASSMAPEGSNDLNFTMYDPTGQKVAQGDLAPFLGSSASIERHFQLDRFGVYNLVIQGNVSLSEYAVRLTQVPPDRFDLTFWWDNVTLGSPGPDAFADCAETVEGGGLAFGSVPPRPDPATFPWLEVIMATAAVAVASLFLVKLVMIARASHAHRTAAKDR